MAKKRPRKRDLFFKKRSTPGASPGTLIADPESQNTRIHVIAYGPDHLEEEEATSVARVSELLGRHPVVWVNVDGLADLATIEALGKLLDLHPLALEDAINLYQRPKVEEYPSNAFVVVRMASGGGEVHTEQLALFIGKGFVATFQGEHPGDSCDPVRKRLRLGQGRTRGEGPDYLAYCLIDAVIDNYFPVMDELGEGIESLEDDLIAAPLPGAPRRIQRAKQDLLILRRAVFPLRDVVNSLVRDEIPFIRHETRLYFRDCYDHTVQLMDAVNTYRELAGGLMELHLSSVSNRMNEVMKFLTLVSTVFIPLTFIVGVYGMNFDPARSPFNMPELEWRYGYPAVLATMAAMAVLLVLYFRRKGWLAPTR
ncbi:MAG TPA: magnesium/cobalt transporter CorA [Polyangiaceae bacterium]